MSVTITGKLNKAANEFQAGESVGFGLRLGEKYYDRETKDNAWTNYEMVVFAKAQAQIDFYRNALVEGAIVEVTGAKQKIKEFTSSTGNTSLSIEILEAKLGFVSSGDTQSQSSPQAPQQRPAPAPQAPSAPAQPEYVMTPKAEGYTREQYLQQGWSDSELISQGYMIDNSSSF